MKILCVAKQSLHPDCNQYRIVRGDLALDECPDITVWFRLCDTENHADVEPSAEIKWVDIVSGHLVDIELSLPPLRPVLNPPPARSPRSIRITIPLELMERLTDAARDLREWWDEDFSDGTKDVGKPYPTYDKLVLTYEWAMEELDVHHEMNR